MDAAQWFDDFKWGLDWAREEWAIGRIPNRREFRALHKRLGELMMRAPISAIAQGGNIAQGARELRRRGEGAVLPLSHAKPLTPWH